MPEPITHPFTDDPVLTGRDDHSAVLIDATPGGVVTITVNRPQSQNALGPEVVLALSEAFETLHGADHVRLVFLRGAGGSFPTGADAEWLAESDGWLEDDIREDALRVAVMLKKLHDLPQLTVALVEGAAFGGGVGLVAACDMAIAVSDVRFALSEAKIGLIPATVAPYVIRAVGPRNARRLVATASWFGATEAHRIGLVDEVVEDLPALEARREALAADAAWVAPGARADAKRLVDDLAELPIDRALLEETARRVAHRRASPEGREGVQAFLNKRKPSWVE